MASFYTNQELPTTSEQAVRQFIERYLAVISAQSPGSWVDQFGDVVPLDAPRATFPISNLTTKFHETGDLFGCVWMMLEESFDLKVVEYDDGYEAKLTDLLYNSFAYRNWMRAPQLFRVAEERLMSQQIVALLEAGTSTASPWDSVNFFSASHLSDPTNASSTQWSNYSSGGTDMASIANLTTEITAMRGVLDQNGDKLGVEPTHILCPTGKFQGVSNVLSQNFINNGESNPLVGKLSAVHVPDLTDTNDCYLIDANLIAMGAAPWVVGVHKPSASLGLRSFGEESDFFKTSGKVKMSAHIWHGYKLVFPHAIRKIVGA